MASASVEPSFTFSLIFDRMTLRRVFSVWSTSAARASVSGTAAPSSVAIWFVRVAMSRREMTWKYFETSISTLRPLPLTPACSLWVDTSVGNRPCRRRRARATLTLSASMIPWTALPPASKPVYWKTATSDLDRVLARDAQDLVEGGDPVERHADAVVSQGLHPQLHCLALERAGLGASDDQLLDRLEGR